MQPDVMTLIRRPDTAQHYLRALFSRQESGHALPESMNCSQMIPWQMMSMLRQGKARCVIGLTMSPVGTGLCVYAFTEFDVLWIPSCEVYNVSPSGWAAVRTVIDIPEASRSVSPEGGCGGDIAAATAPTLFRPTIRTNSPSSQIEANNRNSQRKALRTPYPQHHLGYHLTTRCRFVPSCAVRHHEAS